MLYVPVEVTESLRGVDSLFSPSNARMSVKMSGREERSISTLRQSAGEAYWRSIKVVRRMVYDIGLIWKGLLEER